MASITTLSALFDSAAADWSYTPPPPVEGGGRSPRVMSRSISIHAMFLIPTSGELYGILNYAPAKRIIVSNRTLEIPASFSGNLEDWSLSIAAEASDYFVTFNDLVHPPFDVSFTANPPNGEAGQIVTDPLLNIQFGGANVEGLYQLFQYNFVLTLG
jgi:hypothetical protein